MGENGTGVGIVDTVFVVVHGREDGLGVGSGGGVVGGGRGGGEGSGDSQESSGESNLEIEGFW